MSEWPDLVMIFAISLLLGLVFFGGLWITVILLSHTQRPTLLLLASIILRFLVVLGGLRTIVLFGGADALATSAIAFLLARSLLIRHVRVATGIKQPFPGEKT